MAREIHNHSMLVGTLQLPIQVSSFFQSFWKSWRPSSYRWACTKHSNLVSFGNGSIALQAHPPPCMHSYDFHSCLEARLACLLMMSGLGEHFQQIRRRIRASVPPSAPSTCCSTIELSAESGRMHTSPNTQPAEQDAASPANNKEALQQESIASAKVRGERLAPHALSQNTVHCHKTLARNVGTRQFSRNATFWWRLCLFRASQRCSRMLSGLHPVNICAGWVKKWCLCLHSVSESAVHCICIEQSLRLGHDR